MQGPLATLLLLVAAALAAPLRVLAPASLASALPEAIAAWEAAGGAPVAASTMATSRLALQLERGAPADLVITADERWMDHLESRGLVEAPTRRDLLANSLVIVVFAEDPPPVAAPADLAAIDRVALAGPEVPAGRYARAALEWAGAWEAVAPRVVSADDVRVALAWVARGEAPAGIVYATDARADPRVRVAYAFPEGAHPPIRYPAAVTAGAAQPAEAAALLEFLSGPGRAAFERAGFTVLPDAP